MSTVQTIFYKHVMHPHIPAALITDIGTHKFRRFATFVMKIEIVFSGLGCILCFVRLVIRIKTTSTSFWRNNDVIIASCAHWDIMICGCIKISVLFSFNQSCLYNIISNVTFMKFMAMKLLSISLSSNQWINVSVRKLPGVSWSLAPTAPVSVHGLRQPAR